MIITNNRSSIELALMVKQRKLNGILFDYLNNDPHAQQSKQSH